MGGYNKARMIGGKVLKYVEREAVPGSYRALRNRAPRIKGAVAPYGGRQELKYNDIASANYICDSTGTVTLLNGLAIGDDNTTRDGRQVCIKSVQLKGFVFPVDDTTSHQKVRVVLVWDNSVNGGAAPTIATIFGSASGNSFPVVDQAQRFTILSDQSFAIGKVDNTATTAIACAPVVHNVEIYKKLNSITQYSSTTAAVGSIQSGGLFLLTMGTAAAAAAANLSCAIRVRFTDM